MGQPQEYGVGENVKATPAPEAAPEAPATATPPATEVKTETETAPTANA
jgi:hypothetical protein